MMCTFVGIFHWAFLQFLNPQKYSSQLNHQQEICLPTVQEGRNMDCYIHFLIAT